MRSALLIILVLSSCQAAFADSFRCYVSKTMDVIERRTQPPPGGFECRVACQPNIKKADFDLLEVDITDPLNPVETVIDWADPRKTEDNIRYRCRLDDARRAQRIQDVKDLEDQRVVDETQRRNRMRNRLQRIKTNCPSETGMGLDICRHILDKERTE